MPDQVQTLEIRVNFKAGDAESGLTRLKGLIESVDKASQGHGFTQLRGVAGSMTQLGLAAKNIKDIGPYFEQVGKSAENLFKKFQSFDPKTYASNVAALSGSLRTLGDSMKTFTEGASGMSSKVLENVKNASESVGKMGSSAKTSARSVSLSFSDVGKNMKKVVSLGYQIGKLPFKMILAPIQGIGRGLSNMTGHFTKFLSSIGRIALYRAIRTGIKLVTTAVREGVGNVYEWATIVGNSFQRTMDMIATSSNYLKNSIGAMFSPILDAIAPVLDTIVDKAVSVINVINQLIATLTGATSWRRAEKVATSYSGAADSIGKSASGANDKVKELKRTLLGFDEINRLEADSNNPSASPGSGSGSGSSVPGGSLAFTEQPITSAVQNLADKLRAAWAKADFTEIGTMIGTKIGNALLNVPWETKIQPTVVKLAKSFGTLLNGMFDYTGSGGKAMWDGIAYTIYNAINTAVLGYVTFFDTVHWEGIGQGVGAALKRVLDNLDWDMIARALAAFPNAVINAVTGFSKRFTTQNFYNAGQNIGRTISNALVLINWTGLFGNALNIATGVLTALNGALESFNWSGVKEAILKGIKNIPKSTWSNLGKEIGRAIFNIANFSAHLIDTMVSVIENGGWGDLYNGIKKGISNGMKQYGGWSGVAKKLGSWIVDHIGTISALLTITIGIAALKNLGKKLLTGKLFASMVTSAPLTGGGTLATLGTVPGFIAACAIAVPIGLTVTPIVMEKVDDLVQKFVDAMDPVINPTVNKVTDILTNKNYKPNNIYTGGATAGEKGAPSSTTYKRDLGNGASVWQMPSGDLNLPNLNYDKALEAARNRVKQAVTSGVAAAVAEVNTKTGSADSFAIKPQLDPKSVPNAWKQLVRAWANITKTNKVARFLTEGVVNKATDWWSSVKQFWAQAISGKNAKRFTIEGIVNQAQNWWGQVTNFWRSYISGKNAARFTTEGVQNQAGKWWSQVAGFWASIVGVSTGSPFAIAGVINDAWQWWNQTQNYWDQATSGSNLSATVEIGNPWNAFVSAFNSMQSYFNSHPLTASVQTVQTATKTATNASKSYQRKKAQGGIYKDGEWHDITKYAAGGSPMSGQMFIAREAGPELVGTIGGNTAVMNNNQIVASVAAGVAQAVSSVMGNGGTNEITIKVDSETLYRTVRKGERRASGRYGTTVAIG